MQTRSESHLVFDTKNIQFDLTYTSVYAASNTLNVTVSNHMFFSYIWGCGDERIWEYESLMSRDISISSNWTFLILFVSPSNFSISSLFTWLVSPNDIHDILKIFYCSCQILAYVTLLVQWSTISLLWMIYLGQLLWWKWQSLGLYKLCSRRSLIGQFQ